MSDSGHPKILMSFCTDWYWYDVAKAVITAGIDIKFLVSRPIAVQVKARKELKSTIVINQNSLEYASEIEKLNQNNPIVLSAKMLDQLKVTELEFLQITDRLAFFQLTVSRRKELFKHLVRYWYNFLEQNKLDAIFFTDTPHVGFDTVLFAVATTFFHLPIVSIRRPFIRDRMIVVRDYYKFLPNVPTNYFETSSKKELKQLVGEELLADVFNENSWQKKDKVISQTIHSRTNPVLEIGSRILKNLNPTSTYRYLMSLSERSTYGGFNYNQSQTKLTEKLCGLYHRYYLAKQRKLYNKLANDFVWPLKKKYIYFPLHLQPERSTIPEGGVFEDQFLALEILQKVLPKNWVIIVKEHPRQFHVFDFQKHHFRSEAFYQRLAAFASVRICPMHIAQEELVKEAQVTATITGTGGWESLLIGKPAFIFGNTWYSGCQSSFNIDSLESARSAFNNALKKNRLQVELDVLRFLAYYRDQLVIASNAREFASQSKRPYEALVTNLALAVKKAIENQL